MTIKMLAVCDKLEALEADELRKTCDYVQDWQYYNEHGNFS